MRTVDPILLDAIENGQGEIIWRAKTWADLAAYDATPTTPERVWDVLKADIFSASAKAVLLS